MTKLLLAAVFTASLAAPALAQSYSPGYGTGNIAPVYGAGTAGQQNRTLSVRQTGSNAFAMEPRSRAVRQRGLNAYAMDPRPGFNAYAMEPPWRATAGSTAPAFTGGGSQGYNRNLYNY